LSQHTKDLLFGLGDATRIVKMTVRWPSGQVQEFSSIPFNHRVTIEEGKQQFDAEPFRTPKPKAASVAVAQVVESVPSVVETWLLEPVPAPDFSLSGMDGKTRTLAESGGKPVLLCFWSVGSPDAAATLAMLRPLRKAGGLRTFAIHLAAGGGETDLIRLVDEDLAPFVLRGTEDVAAVYNLLFRYVYDRHRDLPLPTSFLIDEEGKIAKIYVGLHPAENIERDARSMPRNEADRLHKALPFPDSSQPLEFGRNYLSMGAVFFQRGYYEQAEKWFQIASQNDPNSAEAVYGLGSVYLKQERADLARAHFRRATTLHAGYPATLPDAWNNLGLIATREGEIDEAIRYFQQSLTLKPNHLVALENLGNAYRQLHRWDEGRQTLEKALSVSPEDPDAAYSLGMIFAQTNDSEHAYEYLQRALKYRPAYPEALNNLGILYLRSNQPQQAVASFRESIRVAPVFDQAYLNLARVLILQGNREEARTVLLDLLKQHPRHAEAQKLLDQLPR
jgi:tetratricopeptide (TPR) repeat protein/peroxiredoxin